MRVRVGEGRRGKVCEGKEGGEGRECVSGRRVVCECVRVVHVGVCVHATFH